MEGLGSVAPVGMAVNTLGYRGTSAPVNVMVWTLMALPLWAVPIMIDGVRP